MSNYSDPVKHWNSLISEQVKAGKTRRDAASCLKKRYPLLFQAYLLSTQKRPSAARLLLGGMPSPDSLEAESDRVKLYSDDPIKMFNDLVRETMKEKNVNHRTAARTVAMERPKLYKTFIKATNPHVKK